MGYPVLFLAMLLLLMVPRRYAAPLFVGAVFFLHQGIKFEIAGGNFMPARILILTGLARIRMRRERRAFDGASMDKWAMAVAVTYFISGFFHKNVGQALIFRAGMAMDMSGAYFLCRIWIQEWEDVMILLRSCLLFMVPLSILMLYESRQGVNVFNIMANLPVPEEVRNGKFRARGPFRVSILAGTAAAVFFPFALSFWRGNRGLALLSMGGILLAVYASGSSGPFLTLAVALLGMGFWRYRHLLRPVLWSIVACLLGLQMVMNSNVWYLMAYIDVVGGSDSWFRARLIDVALERLPEWWFAGTDYTADWMAQALPIDADSSDITDNFILMAVRGGLPLLISYVGLQVVYFRLLTKTYAAVAGEPGNAQFIIWCFGCFLLAHIVSMIGVDYFDQSETILFAMFGVCASGCSALLAQDFTEPAATGEQVAEEPLPVV